jgi:hypothetical protein
MTRILVVLGVAVWLSAAGQHEPIGATVTLATRVAGSFTFSNPVLGLKGTVDPAPGHRLQIVEIALAATPVYAELDTFRLATTDGREYAPIAVGGAGYSMFPVDRLPLGREVGQVLPTDAFLAVTRNSATSVLLDAGPQATLAFLYELPENAVMKMLKLPDGSRLSIDQRQGAPRWARTSISC